MGLSGQLYMDPEALANHFPVRAYFQERTLHQRSWLPTKCCRVYLIGRWSYESSRLLLRSPRCAYGSLVRTMILKCIFSRCFGRFIPFPSPLSSALLDLGYVYHKILSYHQNISIIYSFVHPPCRAAYCERTVPASSTKMAIQFCCEGYAPCCHINL